MKYLEEIKNNFKEDSFNGHWLYGYQIEWLIEQAEKLEKYEKTLIKIGGNRCCGFHWQHVEVINSVLDD